LTKKQIWADFGAHRQTPIGWCNGGQCQYSSGDDIQIYIEQTKKDRKVKRIQTTQSIQVAIHALSERYGLKAWWGFKIAINS